jgi:DNA primase
MSALPAGIFVVLAFDGDPAGERLAEQAAGLAGGARVMRHRPTDAKDWNDCLQRREREYIAAVQSRSRSPSIAR